MQERALAERLITYDTSQIDGIKAAAGFVKGWLESHEIEVKDGTAHDLPVLAATVGAADGPTVVLHGHIDVVPGREAQFEPRVEGDRLIGRGAYDMKGGLAGMMCALRDLAAQNDVRVHFVCVSDEESDEPWEDRGTDYVVARGYVGDFAITGEPTDLRIGVQSKGVLALRLAVAGTSAHGSTPWLGDNAILKAVDAFRSIQAMPFAREASELFDRPSISLGRIMGGDRINKVPDLCAADVDIRYLPGQDPDAILAAIAELPDVSVDVVFRRAPAIVARDNPHVHALAATVSRWTPEDRISIGRDGASDANSFLDAGTPAVEFGPVGGGHHGPDEWVSVESLAHYREALVDFVTSLPQALGKGHLRIA
ncbi:MAG: succinyl-diaminopimelate desuccinylase [Thermoleophilaceae bacterium]|jgi:succinyl-diaminopimelate desuccinylase|nr:succinyl-diaminopimelate desuccinylase [Thermoleophilaceae bacterium]MEA2353690.1 succinyl-diaminopimelate desuccinylase [Thermoleophilaceae bacterium]MEA2388887.1 succinyl-diaminopimelate desuccinylase [Thermoleophilaceae bacterium]